VQEGLCPDLAVPEEGQETSQNKNCQQEKKKVTKPVQQTLSN
jgi:hypothetical protein